MKKPLTYLSYGLMLAALSSLPVARGLAAEKTPQVFDVRAFGARGDGTTLDTDAINRAIEAAAQAGGGTVWFSAGSYASYSIHLRSHVALHLDAGATILAADPPPAGTPGGYDAPEPNEWAYYQDFGHTHWHNSLIWGENLEDIAIVGPGRIFGRGLSRGQGRKDPLPGEERPRRERSSETAARADAPQPGPFGYPNARDTLPAGVGNKSIALKNCRNVLLRDFTVYHGGHFALLATGVDNLTIDNLWIDTNRDGMDIDCCRNVRVSNCTVNSPRDDAICLKSSYGLGELRGTENVTITNCQVSGYVEGTLLDGTRQRPETERGQPTGRIKLGTEANGGFKNITISNCVFEYCRGLALEEVDGGALEDIAISNLTMRQISNAPIFIRLGSRLRGPDNPEMGVARRIKISHVIATDVSPEHGILITGIPDHPIEDVSLSDILIIYRGGGTAADARRVVPEDEKEYPEPSRFGRISAWGMFARHVRNLSLRDVELRTMEPDHRPIVHLEDVDDATFVRFTAAPAADAARMMLQGVKDLRLRDVSGLSDQQREAVADEKL